MISKGYDLKADVLKVGYHMGRLTAQLSNFKKVNCKYAVISVGKGNIYGHPAKSTLDRLYANNIKVYRTDLNGTVIATSDGTIIKFDKLATPDKSQAQPSPTGTITKPGSGNSNIIVYITKTGTKYHLFQQDLIILLTWIISNVIS